MLTILKTGAGSGGVASVPTGIQCDPTCTAEFPTDSQITLYATPDGDSEFVRWEGDCSGTSRSYIVTMNADKTCTASFFPGSLLHGITFYGPPWFNMSPFPNGCLWWSGGGNCSFRAGTVVTITPSPSPGWIFAGSGWRPAVRD